ncbi:MAG TPA: RS21-C6 protein [Alphaproteobacteria bacterium]
MTDSMPKALEFPESMTLPALQQHAMAVCRHFGWDKASDEKCFLLFIEEVGELAKAMRKAMGYTIEQNNPDKPVQNAAAIQANLTEEFADVLNYFVELACRFNIDLEQAYKTKTLDNMQRQWN